MVAAETAPQSWEAGTRTPDPRIRLEAVRRRGRGRRSGARGASTARAVRGENPGDADFAIRSRPPRLASPRLAPTFPRPLGQVAGAAGRTVAGRGVARRGGRKVLPE